MNDFRPTAIPTGPDWACPADHDHGARASLDRQTFTAANGCDLPCPECTSYYTCILPGPHDGPHYCDHGHGWTR
jgi:hypothetical protein